MNLYTIGHSNHPIERFVGLLKQHDIALVTDVRSVPHSRRHPQFNRETLARELGQAGIGYQFLGRELGARADDPLLYEKGRVSYSKLAETGLFQFGLDRLRELATSKRTAIMCAEKEPLDCHRTLLVARALCACWRAAVPGGRIPERNEVPATAGEDAGPPVHSAGMIQILHIHADGKLESHRECMQRLVKATKLPPRDLFKSEEELIEEACRKREEKIALKR